MAETNIAGTFSPNAENAVELPVAGFQSREIVQDEVGLHLAQLNPFGVVSREWRAVRDYLERYPDLAAVLPAICQQARREFEPPDELAIELYRDPEIKDEYLTLYIRQPRYEPDLMDRIERLSEAFSEQLEHASSYLLVTSDFSPPRGSDVL